MMMAESDPSRRNEHSRQAILDAALRVVTERGYEGTSIEGIAEHAGVGKTTIYRWWTSKGAVILEALEERIVRLAPLPLLDSGSVVENLRQLMHLALRILSSPDFGPAFRAVVAAAQSDPELARANHEKLIEIRAAPMRTMLTEAQRRGEIRADVDLDTVLDMLFGTLFYRILLQTRPLDPEQVDGALDIVFEGAR